ncbi:hypothetical protein FJZ48_03595 [Candidatus Uhrbacteria bacterium]|nr:hypothetical protein [Candidatus Uhrbacteria bacterium]
MFHTPIVRKKYRMNTKFLSRSQTIRRDASEDIEYDLPMISSLIDFLQKRLKTDMRYLLKGGSLLSIMHVVSSIVSFILTIAFANLIAPETYGIYRYVLSTYALIKLLALPGIDAAVLQSTSRGFEGVLRESFWRKFRWSFLGSCVSIGIALWNFSAGDATLGSLFVLIACVLPLMEAPTTSSFLNGKKLYRFWVFSDVSSLIISGAALVAALALTDHILFIILAYFLPQIFTRLFVFLYTQKHFVTNQQTDPGLLRYGKQVTLFQVISGAIASIDQIVLFHILGPANLAVFSLAQAIPLRVQGLLRITGILASPKFAVRSPREIARSMWPKLLAFAGLILLSCVCYVLIAPFFFKLFFPKYIASVGYSQVLIFFTLSAMTYPFSSLLFAHKKMKESYVIGIGSFLAKVAALALFVPSFGIWGGVASILAASATTIFISLFFLIRLSRSPTLDEQAVALVSIADKTIDGSA